MQSVLRTTPNKRNNFAYLVSSQYHNNLIFVFIFNFVLITAFICEPLCVIATQSIQLTKSDKALTNTKIFLADLPPNYLYLFFYSHFSISNRMAQKTQIVILSILVSYSFFLI